MDLICGIKAWLKGWKKINQTEVPKLVWKAYLKWEKRPYNMTKHFVGNRFIYQVKLSIGNHRETPIIRWYRKNRGLVYPEGIPKNKRGMKRWQKENQVIYQPKDFRNPFEP